MILSKACLRKITKLISRLTALLSLLLRRCTQAKVNFREKEKQVLDNILGPGRYDARIRPSGENGTGEYRDTRASF